MHCGSIFCYGAPRTSASRRSNCAGTSDIVILFGCLTSAVPIANMLPQKYSQFLLAPKSQVPHMYSRQASYSIGQQHDDIIMRSLETADDDKSMIARMGPQPTTSHTICSNLPTDPCFVYWYTKPAWSIKVTRATLHACTLAILRRRKNQPAKQNRRVYAPTGSMIAAGTLAHERHFAYSSL